MVERRSWCRWARARRWWNVLEAGWALGRDWMGGRVVVVVV